MIPCGDILRWEVDNAFNGYLTNFLNNNENILQKNGESIEDAICENITKLKDSFWQRESFCYGIYDAKCIEDALEVFILSNNTGKQLDKSDLIIATLQTSWNNISAGDEIDALNKSLNSKFVGSKPFDRKKLLKIFLAVAPFNIPISYSISAVNAEIIDYLEGYWPKFVSLMQNLITLTNAWGLNRNKALTSVNALIPVAVWLQKNSVNVVAENEIDKRNLEIARRWLLIAMVTSTFGGSSEQALSTARKVILNIEGDDFPLLELLDELDEHNSYNLKNIEGVEDMIGSFSYKIGSNKTSIRQLLMLIRDELNYDAEYHLDHIFPRATFERLHPEFVHKVENLALLTGRENAIKSNQTPATFWQNDRFNSRFRESNQLPVDKCIENNMAIYDDPIRLWECRFQEMTKRVFSMLNPEFVQS